MEREYIFLSFSSFKHGPLGCCIIISKDKDNANLEAEELGLKPEGCDHIQGFSLEEDSWEGEGMKLNRFYTAAEMDNLGHEKEIFKII